VSRPPAAICTADLPVGNYRWKFRPPVSRPTCRRAIILQVASNVTVNVPMQIGAVTESIRVEANAAHVETKGELRGAGHQRAEHDRRCRLNGRNPIQLLTLTGAGTSTMTLNAATSPAARTSRDPTVRASLGGRSQANGINFLLDGGDNTTRSATSICRSRPHFIQEFNVQTNGLPGRSTIASRRCGQHRDQIGSERFPWRPVRLLRNGDLNAGRKAPQPRPTQARHLKSATISAHRRR